MNYSDTSWACLGARFLTVGLLTLTAAGCSDCHRTPGSADTKGKDTPADAGPTSTAPSAKPVSARPARADGPPSVAGFRRYDLEPCQVSVTMPCQPELKLQGRRDPSGKPQSLVYLATCGALNFGINCTLASGRDSRQSALENNHRSAVEGVSGPVVSQTSGPNYKVAVVRSMQGSTSIKTQVLDSGSTISLIVAPTEGIPEAMLAGFLESLQPFVAIP